MSWDWLIPLIIFMIIMSFLISIWSMSGVGGMIYAIRSTRRIRTEQEPRDQYDRWLYSHRRSAIESKPGVLRHMWVTGDQDVPRKRIGHIKGIEPWRTNYLIFVKSRRWRWSVPYVAAQKSCSDINRRNLWIKARGVSSLGTIRIPIPLGDVEDTEKHTIQHMDGFRVSFEAQVHMDILEDMAWDISNAMAPPMKERVRAAEVEQPQVIDRDFITEDSVAGGSK